MSKYCTCVMLFLLSSNATALLFYCWKNSKIIHGLTPVLAYASEFNRQKCSTQSLSQTHKQYNCFTHFYLIVRTIPKILLFFFILAATKLSSRRNAKANKRRHISICRQHKKKKIWNTEWFLDSWKRTSSEMKKKYIYIHNLKHKTGKRC